MAINPELSSAEEAMLERFGPAFKPQAINAPEIPDFVKQAIMARSASPRPTGMAGVYDRAMNESLNIPMNIKALAGIDPSVANQFMQSTQGMAMANRYGNTPEERAQRDKMMAAVGIGGQQLAAAGDTNRAIAANNVGLKNADANMMGGIASGANDRAMKEYETEYNADFTAGENRAAEAHAEKMLALEDENKKRANEQRYKHERENALIQGANGDLKFAVENIQQQARLAEERVNQMVQNGSITEEQAQEELNKIQTQAVEESQKAVQASLAARNKLLQGDMTGIAPYMPGRISGPAAASGMKSAVIDKLLSDKFSAAQDSWGSSIGLGNTAARNFVESLPESFGAKGPNAAKARAALKKFIANNSLEAPEDIAAEPVYSQAIKAALLANPFTAPTGGVVKWWLDRTQSDVARKLGD